MTEHGSFASAEPVYGEEPASGRGVVRIAAVAALGGFLFGYDSAVINGAVSAIEGHFSVASGVLGFAVASVLLGAAVGAMTAGRLADRFGRLLVMKSPRSCLLSAHLALGCRQNCGCSSRSGLSADLVWASPRLSPRPISRRYLPRISGDGLARCNSSPSCPASFSRC